MFLQRIRPRLLAPFIRYAMAALVFAAMPMAKAAELNLWVMATTDGQQRAMHELLRPFLAANPNTRVNVTVLNWDSAWTKITAAAASGHGPDVVELGTTWVPAIAAMDALEPLSAAQIAQSGGPSAFFPVMWDTTHVAGDDKTFALPWYAEARAAFYRTDVFKKAGVSPNDAFANWGSFKQAMQKINGTEINGRKVAALGYPGKDDANVIHHLAPWIWNAGGDLLSADRKRSTINSTEAVQAIVYYTSFASEGLVPTSALSKDSGQIEVGFFNGQYAVVFAGPWMLKQAATPKAKGGQLESIGAANFGIAPYPAGLKGKQTLFSGSDLALMKSSKSKAEAWKLLQFLTSREAEVGFSKISGMLPTRLDAANDPSLMANPHYAQFLAQISKGRHYPSVPSWGPLEAVYTKTLGTMFGTLASDAGHYSPLAVKQAMDAAAWEADRLLHSKR